MAAATNSDDEQDDTTVKMISRRANNRMLVQFETGDGQPCHTMWIDDQLVQQNQLFQIFSYFEQWRPFDQGGAGAEAQNVLDQGDFGDGVMGQAYVASRASYNYGVYHYDVDDMMTTARHGLIANPACKASMIANYETVKSVSKAVCNFSSVWCTQRQCALCRCTGRGHDGAVRE